MLVVDLVVGCIGVGDCLEENHTIGTEIAKIGTALTEDWSIAFVIVDYYMGDVGVLRIHGSSGLMIVFERLS